MTFASDLYERLRHLVMRSREERELADELSFHLEMETEKNVRAGMTWAEARRQAQLALGGVEGTKEEVRQARGTKALEDLRRDISFAVRRLRREKLFTASVLLVLAIGLGANAATFSVIDALMLRELPVVREPDRLVTIGDPRRTGALSRGTPQVDLASYPLYVDLRDQNTVLTGVYATGRAGRLDLTIDGADGAATEHPRGRLVSGNYFSVLGLPAYLGRTFTAEEDRAPGADPVAVISYSYWQRRFGGDRGALGRTVTINGAPLTIIGVAPPGFEGDIVGQPIEIWIPLMMQPAIMPHRDWLTDRSVSWLLMMGRLAPGVTAAGARAALTEVMGRSLLENATPDDLGDIRDQLRDGGVRVEPGARGFSYYRSAYAPSLLTLMVAVALVLLVVCGNVGNLMLARAERRRLEMSVRRALGSGRPRLVQQLLTESLLLALIGGALGLVVAYWGSQVLLHLAGRTQPMPLDVRIDGRMFGFTFLVALATAILFGLVPAVRGSRVELAAALRAGRGATGRTVQRRSPALGSLLVAVQFALSLVLLVGTALLARSAQHLRDADLGLTPERLVIARVDATRSGYAGARLAALLNVVTERVGRVPGVTGVALSENGLFSGTESAITLAVAGFSALTADDTTVNYDNVSHGYFQTIGARLLLGRDFDQRDGANAAQVAVVNETMARFYFPEANPIGRQVSVDSASIEIVGVVADVEGSSVRGEPTRRMYLPVAQQQTPPGSFYVQVRAAEPAYLVEPIRRALLEADPAIVVLRVNPLTELIHDSLVQDRLVSRVVSFFGGLALFLAALGLYSVMAYATARRTAEFGLRMALGARPRNVTRMMLKRAMILTAIGVAVGFPAALAATQLLRSQLFGIGPFDPVSLLLAIAVLGASAVAAAYVPALRASRVPPVDALRIE